jgi:hypothetical protein
LPFSKKNGPPLAFWHCFKRLLKTEEILALALSTGGNFLENVWIADYLELASATIRVPACQTDVAGDREKPGQLDVGDDSALKRSQRMHERRLQRVVSFVPVAQVIGAVGENAVGVALVEGVDGQRAWRGGGGLDACSTTE